MINVKGKTYTVPVQFVIQPNKQKHLLQILRDYSRVQISKLSALLNVPVGKINAVIEEKEYFSEAEIKLLVQYFCICCGE